MYFCLKTKGERPPRVCAPQWFTYLLFPRPNASKINTLRLLSCVSPIFPQATLRHGARSSVHGRRRTFQSLIIRLFHPLPRATVPPEIRLTGEAVVTTIYLPSIKAVIEQISAVSYFNCDQYDDSRTPAPNNSVLNSVITTTENGTVDGRSTPQSFLWTLLASCSAEPDLS